MCGGMLNKKYKRGPIVIYYRESKEQFKVREKRETIYGYQPVANLENVLNNLNVAV